jgi:ectoine hydroxylase
MTPENVLSHRPKILSQKQREDYFQKGYILVERVVPSTVIEGLRNLTQDFVERSRGVTVSDRVFDIEPGHTAAEPRLRRLSSPVDQHPLYWEFASTGVIADLMEDLLGPNVKFHHSKLNFKWSKGGQEVKWHQDIQSWPHTNYSPLTIGTYLHDVTDDMGPLLCVPGSHEGELYDQYKEDGSWAGYILDRDISRVEADRAEALMGPAGSVTIHNCRTVHASRPNLSPTGRPLLLHTYSASDAFPYTPNPIPSRHAGTMIRGVQERWARHDPRPCLVPPDWAGGYISIFNIQQKGGQQTDGQAGAPPAAQAMM